MVVNFDENMETKNLAIIRQTYANTVFTHKVQEVAATLQEAKAYKTRVLNIMLILGVLVLLLLQSTYPEKIILSYIASGISVAEIILLIVQLDFAFEKRAIMHKSSAHKYMGLRDKYRCLITDIMNGSLSEEMIISNRNSLQTEYQIVSELAPQTGQEEYSIAQAKLNKKGLVSGEEFTWTDSEIDRFLPENLRLTQQDE